MRIPKACALTTTACISNKRGAAIPPTHRQSGWMVLGLEFEGSKLQCRPHEGRLRAASAMLFSTPSLAILVPKPQLVPPLGSFLSAASRSSASVGAESGVDVASSAPARCNVTRHREQNCQGSAHCYLSNRFRSDMPQVASDRYCSFAGLEILRQSPGSERCNKSRACFR